MIKRIFFVLIISCTLGSLIGIVFHNKISSDVFAFNEGYPLYFIRQGVYTDKDILDVNTESIDPKLIINKDNKYYVYVGITSNEKIAKQIEEIYDDMNIEVNKTQMSVNDESFVNNVKQFDSIILSSKKDEILNVEEVILSNYEEVFGSES